MKAPRFASFLLVATVCVSTAVWGAAPSSPSHPRLNTPELRYNFENYLSLDHRVYFKIFVLSEQSGWAWVRDADYEAAVNKALRNCDALTYTPGRCRLFAVGDEIVWDMSEQDRGRTIDAYVKARVAGKKNLHRPELALPQDGFGPYLAVPHASGFKVFFAAKDSAWAWAWRRTFEGAIRDARASCERASSSRQCDLAAIGNTVILGMSAKEKDALIKSYSRTAGRLAPMGNSALEGFEKYRLHDEAHGFKAFYLSDDGAWSYRSFPSVDRAMKEAMKGCRKHRRHGDCHLYALGNTIVWGMSDDDLSDAVARYEELNLPFASLPRSNTSAFDGNWAGRMRCNDCPNCNGALEKRLDITILNGRFEIVPDLTYYGIGLVNAAGAVSVWSKRDFRFDGHAMGSTITLNGQRGVRSCQIALERSQ